MTGNKLWRLSLAAILGFGWLFLTPAQSSSDELTTAAQQIAQLKEDVKKLNDKAATQELIDIAEYKYDQAVQAKQSLTETQALYEIAIQEESEALEEKNTAQSFVDGQTATVNIKLNDKNESQDAYQAAQISLNAHIATYGVPGGPGVSFQIYPLSRTAEGYAYIAPGSGLMCQGSISSFNIWAGSGSICYLSQNIIGIFRSTLTIPENINSVYFAAATDDGSRIYVNGVLESELWVEQGTTWSPFTRVFDTSVDKTLELEVWWYNGGGPGNMTLGWGHSGIWTGIPQEYLSYGTPLSEEVQEQRYLLQLDLNEKYSIYQSDLSEYNLENNILIGYQNTLNSKTNIYNNSVSNKENTYEFLQLQQLDYENSILEMQLAITNAQNEYNKQWQFEESQRVAAAIAKALTNQPKPEATPEPQPSPTELPEPSPEPQPTVEPSPIPTPEEPKPIDPTPEPTIKPEPTPEPTIKPEPTPEVTREPAVEPSKKPSPEPTEITPTPQPTVIEPSPKPSSNNTINDLAALANLTSKDNITVKLTSEQMAAVSSTLASLSKEAKAEVAGVLGIKADEIAIIAEAAKSNPVIATAVVEFSNRAEENKDAPMPYTLADATTEIQAEQFLSDPLGALTNIDFEKVLNPSEWGKDMTDDQRKKAQEVVIPVVIVSNIVAAAMTRRI